MWSHILSNSPNFLPGGFLFHLHQRNRLNTEMQLRNERARLRNPKLDNTLLWENAINQPDCASPGATSRDSCEFEIKNSVHDKN